MHHTANIIEQTWRYYLQPLLGIPLGQSVIEGLTIAHGNVATLLQTAIQEQTAIGWDKLLLGLGSSTWKAIQDAIDSANPNAPKRNATDWMNSAVYQLIKFSLRCWKCRNTMIHGASRQEQRQIALQRVRDKITEIYANPPTLAPQFRSIYELPLTHRIKMSLHAAEHWVSLITHQAKVSHHNFQCLLRRHKPMKTHLRTMRREARSQAKERAQPTTPRKVHSRAVQAAVQEMRHKLYAKRANKMGTTTIEHRRTRGSQPASQPSTHLALMSSIMSPTIAHPILRLHPP
jgi:hypothetical protein